MENHITSAARCSHRQEPWLSWHSRKMNSKNIYRLPCHSFHCSRMRFQRLVQLHHTSLGKDCAYRPFWKVSVMPVSLEHKLSSSTSPEEYPSDNIEVSVEDSSERVLPQLLGTKELKSLLADSERSKLIRKLSEANQHNRFFKRQIQIKEDALVTCKSELAVLELELQALITLAEEVAKSGIQPGSRKINGKYIQSCLLSRLEAAHKTVRQQIKDVDVIQAKEVLLFWYGMAESIQVMGSFDGWSQGEHLSPEYTGSVTKFSTKLLLRPGRYEIKFMVDGEWKLSPEFPTTGEGMLENNLLIVE